MRTKLVVDICLALIIGLSIWLRVVLPYDAVFSDDTVKFSDVDAYYHMRLADYAYENFPDTMKFDPMLDYPDGREVTLRPVVSWSIAGISRLTGVPLNTVAAYFPAVFGVLLAIPVFVIGALLFGKWAGLMGAVFTVVIPGELLARSSLGNADHHVLEVFFATLVVMFLVLALKKNWLWSTGAGIALGLYNINWAGAPLLTTVLLVWLVVQFTIYHYRKADVEEKRLTVISTITLGLAFLISLSFTEQPLHRVFFMLAALVPIFALYLSRWLAKVRPIYFPLTLGLAGAIAVGIAYFLEPVTVSRQIMSIVGAGTTTIDEARRMTFTTSWAYFGLCLWTGIAGWLVMMLGKERSKAENMLFIVWSAATLALMLLQRRFAYYAVANIGLLTGYVSWMVLRKASIRRLTKKERKRGVSPINWAMGGLTGFAIISLLFVPNVVHAERSDNPFLITDGWLEATDWLREETPEGDYSVLSWWDYGYWIAREGGRAVICDPGGGHITPAAKFLTAQDDRAAMEVAEAFGVRYVVIDWQMVYGKFRAISTFVEDEITEPDLCLMRRLWEDRKYSDVFRPVFESKAKWKDRAEVRIFEVVQ